MDLLIVTVLDRSWRYQETYLFTVRSDLTSMVIEIFETLQGNFQPDGLQIFNSNSQEIAQRLGLIETQPGIFVRTPVSLLVPVPGNYQEDSYFGGCFQQIQTILFREIPPR